MYSNINDIYSYKLPKSSLNDNREFYQDLEKLSKSSELVQTSNPKVWGPIFWKTLHIMSVYYPMKASPIVRQRMKSRILCIPYELPCEECRSHCISFIESKYDDLDNIVSGRDELVKFFTNFHNAVNKRHGKSEWTVQQVYELYLEGKGFEC